MFQMEAQTELHRKQIANIQFNTAKAKLLVTEPGHSCENIYVAA